MGEMQKTMIEYFSLLQNAPEQTLMDCESVMTITEAKTEFIVVNFDILWEDLIETFFEEL